ncbi:hypothetical protein EK21DRAFT_116187 [Setomelanomma holmii]|uniref:Uncharacterized protein n=1 Tax=Setomelanomma holmii TaxID=210430 RepID=A0A9P4H302_9PLEO|nr:hypothetical protein EK21DRAFT_116187 [Setomelanomma holmii]
MSQKKVVPGSLKAFFKEGIEEAQCHICFETFDNNYIAIEIKELPPVPDNVSPPPPPVRTLLSTTSPISTVQSPASIPHQAALPTPSPSVHFYSQNAVVRASNQISSDTEEAQVRKTRTFRPYVSKLYGDSSVTACPVVALAQTLPTISKFCNLDWKSILTFHTNLDSTLPSLNWRYLCEGGWTEQWINGQAVYHQPPNDWRVLHLLLCIISMHRAQRLPPAQNIKIPKVRDMLRATDIGYPTVFWDARDTKKRLFLSVAVQAYVTGAVDDDSAQDEHGRRLADSSTDVTQVKLDVEAI